MENMVSAGDRTRPPPDRIIRRKPPRKRRDVPPRLTSGREQNHNPLEFALHGHAKLGAFRYRIKLKGFCVMERLPVFFRLASMMIMYGATCLLAACSPGTSSQSSSTAPPAGALFRDPSMPIERRIDDLLGRMTMQEKLGQLHESHSQRGKFDAAAYADEIRAGDVGAMIWTIENPEQRNTLQKIAVEQTRLGIPLIFALDVIHGQRTVFPISLGLSCAWDPDLYEQSQAVAGREARASGVDWVFAPMSDLPRDPRWGRVAETCGEDPYLASLCVPAAVRGFQGEMPPGGDARADRQIAADRVAACLKHYVGYSAAIGGRDYNTTDITELGLRNFHLPSFRAGVAAGALTVMSSFNAIDGIPATDNHHTLTEILRDEWGFRGVVVSDWEAVVQTIAWGYAADASDAARRALSAGTDMEMLSTTYRTLGGQVAGGLVQQSGIDEAVRRVLRLKFELGLFEHPYVDAAAYPSAILHPADLQLARQCVARSAVLLKNNGVLPLSKQLKTIAVIGPFGDDKGQMLGCWPGKGHAEDVVTLAQGIRAKLSADAQVQVVKGCEILSGQPMTRTLIDGTIVPESSAPATSAPSSNDASTIADVVRAAGAADAVVMALGEPRSWTGENGSRATLGLTGHQQELFDAVAATGKPVVVVVFSGRPLALPKVAANAAALLFAWQPGVQAGNGLADLLFGDCAPVGRLTMSVPSEVGQVPVYYNHDSTGRPLEEMGNYRDYTRDAMYEFGFGLTYTTFEYGQVRIDLPQNGHPAVASATVTNTGNRRGEEIAQLYIRQLACPQGVRPIQELRGFRHVTLEPGQSAQISFELNDQVLGYFMRDGRWVVDGGKYQIWIAPHAGTGEPTLYDREP
jgi:beta-glucosidase